MSADGKQKALVGEHEVIDELLLRHENSSTRCDVKSVREHAIIHARTRVHA